MAVRPRPLLALLSFWGRCSSPLGLGGFCGHPGTFFAPQAKPEDKAEPVEPKKKKAKITKSELIITRKARARAPKTAPAQEPAVVSAHRS